MWVWMCVYVGVHVFVWQQLSAALGVGAFHGGYSGCGCAAGTFGLYTRSWLQLKHKVTKMK